MSDPSTPPNDDAEPLRVRRVENSHDLATARTLFTEYRNWLAEHREVTAFADSILAKGLRDLDEEIRGLPGAYAPPSGALFLAERGATPLGCAGLRPWEPGVGELKRLYVRPVGRGHGIGRQLSDSVLRQARHIGYRRIVLDTLPTMRSAVALYRGMGFRPIPAYWPSPITDSLFFEISL